MKRVSVSVARITLGDLLEEVATTKKPIIITKGRRGSEGEIEVMLAPVKKGRK